MGARSNFRHDPAIGSVLGNLAQNLIGEDLAFAIDGRGDNRRRCLIARRFNSQHLQGHMPPSSLSRFVSSPYSPPGA